MKRRGFKKRLFRLLTFLLICAAVSPLFFHFYRCPIYSFFGVPCPGCGMTRALRAALTLDFSKAFYYHPLFWLVLLLIPAGAVFYLSGKPYTPKIRRLVIGIALVFVGVYIVRLIMQFGQNEVMMLNKNAVVFKIWDTFSD